VTRLPIPNPSYLDCMEYQGFVHGAKRWRSLCGQRLYTWDSYHGEIEVFNKRGRHISVIDVTSGNMIKEAVKGRKVDV
jgi:hypothetical protein